MAGRKADTIAAATQMQAQPRAPGARWLMLMPNIPGKATTERVRIWRRLQSVGAVAVRPSVYVLPLRDEHLETFEWIARELVELGGNAALCEGRFVDGATDAEIDRKFVEARSADYTELAEEVRAVTSALSPKRGGTKRRAAAGLAPEKLAALDAQLSKLRRRLDEIIAIDFADAPGREGVEGLLAGAERAVASRRDPGKVPERLPTSPRPRGATWVTRVGVHVDRIACSWLICRFIDPAATLKFVPPKGYVPEPGELRFDMFEAEFTHVGDRCSFEVLLERMGIDDPSLHSIAEIIHDLDVRDEKFERPETAGVLSQITGVCAAHRDDLARIAAATPMFESLYAFFSLRGHGPKRSRT